MIIVNIGLDGKPDIQRIILGNKYENNDETINFVLPDEINQYHKYIIAVMEMTEEPNITTLLPVNDNAFVVSSSLTYKSGTWKLYLMCRENEVDISGDVVDISPKENEHVWISNTMFGVVNDNLIDKEIVDNIPLDTNLKIIYDDLNALIDSVNTKLENGDFNGKDGQDGFSPSASVTQEEDGAVISVTDKSGSTSVKVLNGKNGSDGADGKSAYDLAVENGFEGTEDEWIESLNGKNGDKGDTGLTPNIQIGTVTTLEPDQQATVERVGTNEEPLFNFGIPRGKDSDVQQEVEDIRVGYDGEKYESAGEAVRGQVEELSYVTNKESQIILDELLLDKQIDFSENGYYKPYGDGITLDTSAGRNTGYVDVGLYKKIRYTVSGTLPYIYYVAYFDKDKEFISGVKDGAESFVENESDIPHNARFVIISTFSEKYQLAFFVGSSEGLKKGVEVLKIKSESLKTIGENIGLSIALENIGYYRPDLEEIVFDDDIYGRNTGLISVFGFSKIKATNVSGGTNYMYPIVFFDINKVPMKEYSILKTESDTYEADIPESAFYACVSTWSQTTYDAKCILGNNEYFGKIEEIKQDIQSLNNKTDGIEDKIGNLESSLSRINFNCLEFSTFAKFGVSGDSITVGYTRNPMTEEDVGRNIYYSWGQFIARRNGNICLNFGKSGMTSKQWMTDELCYNRLINPDNLCQAYVIALGANDAAQENLNVVPFGSIQDVDFSNMENNADTVYGWYAKVINAHIVTAPKAKIFLITIPYWRNTDPNVQTMNNLIREMASRPEFKNVFLVDIDSEYNDYFKNGVFPDIWYAGGHYSAIGYNYYSRIHEYAISKVMKDNNDKFNDIPFIPFGSNNVLD